MTSRIEGTYTSTWVYDEAAHGIGKLYTASTSAGYVRSYNYDSRSRPILTRLTIAGAPYVYQTSYDSYGRVATVSYPSGFIAKYVYTSLSYQSQVVDNATGSATCFLPTRHT